MKYYVVRTAFHGGGIVSRHLSRERAEAAARRYRAKDCICGCAGVFSDEEYEQLETLDENQRHSHNPYALVQ